MGEAGRGFAKLNLHWFGYFGYVYLLFLIYPAYALYKDSKLTAKRLKILIATLLVSVGILLLQSIFLHKGEIGDLLIAKITPIFGELGVGICVFLCIFGGVFLLFPRQVLSIKNKICLYGTRLFVYLKENFIIAYTYLKPIAKQYITIISQKIQKFFDSSSLDSFNKPNTHTQGDMQHSQATHTKLDSSVYHSATSSTLQHQSTTPQNQASQWNLDTHIVDLPDKYQTPESKKIEFDSRDVLITYTNDELQKQRKIQEEQKYAKMVRLVGENEEGETLKINPSEIIEKAKKREQNIDKIEQTNQFKYIKLESKKPESTPAQTDITTSITQEPTIPLIQDECMTHDTIFNTTSPNNLDDTHAPQSPTNQTQIEDTATHIQAESSILDTTILDNNLDSSLESSAKQSTNPYTESNLTKVKIAKEFDETNKLLKNLDIGILEKPKDYILPDTSLLGQVPPQKINFEEGEIDQKIQNLLTKLKVFKIDGDVVRIYSGPVVTTFEFRPAPNVKVSRIQSLSDDLAMALCASSIRIQAPIPGKDVVGIEVPNSESQTIYMREILESDVFKTSSSPLALGLGKDIVGNPFVTDLKKLPHLLIAGTTGSGKSVGVNAMILSLLYRNSPDNLRLIMIDPKKVEFSLYEEIPHLLTPIITDSKKAIIALNNVAKEMERRYEIMKEIKTKTIDGYNQRAKEEGGEILPFIVVIIDELADLMMTGGKEAEASIIRIAQMGRAAGLHLIVATQRPSVDVVTGLIKTNLPAKIAFKVGSRMDSRVILDSEGAQNLLGKGDMLFSIGGGSNILRLHAPWTSEEEIEKIVAFIRNQRSVEYDSSFLADNSQARIASQDYIPDSQSTDLIEEAKKAMLMDGKTSISNLQRRLGIGYNKAASIVEDLEKQGFLSAPNTKGVREILNPEL